MSYYLFFSLDQKTWWFLSPIISAVLSWVFLMLLWLNTNIGLPNLLRSLGSWKQVTASAWVDDFREQIERTRILRTVYRSATALSSRLQSIASLSRATLPYSTLMVARAAQTGAAGAGAIWRPVSSGTQVPQICIVATIMFKLSFFCFHILPTCENCLLSQALVIITKTQHKVYFAYLFQNCWNSGKSNLKLPNLLF